MNLFNKKTNKIIATTIGLILVLSMVVSLVASWI